ncbi:uncharacterized protein MONBRDRAFT_36191, partial [Monosiga brevicollis MX1]
MGRTVFVTFLFLIAFCSTIVLSDILVSRVCFAFIFITCQGQSFLQALAQCSNLVRCEAHVAVLNHLSRDDPELAVLGNERVSEPSAAVRGWSDVHFHRAPLVDRFETLRGCQARPGSMAAFVAQRYSPGPELASDTSGIPIPCLVHLAQSSMWQAGQLQLSADASELRVAIFEHPNGATLQLYDDPQDAQLDSFPFFAGALRLPAAAWLIRRVAKRLKKSCFLLHNATTAHEYTVTIARFNPNAALLVTHDQYAAELATCCPAVGNGNYVFADQDQVKLSAPADAGRATIEAIYATVNEVDTWRDSGYVQLTHVQFQVLRAMRHQLSKRSDGPDTSSRGSTPTSPSHTSALGGVANEKHPYDSMSAVRRPSAPPSSDLVVDEHGYVRLRDPTGDGLGQPMADPVSLDAAEKDEDGYVKLVQPGGVVVQHALNGGYDNVDELLGSDQRPGCHARSFVSHVHSSTSPYATIGSESTAVNQVRAVSLESLPRAVTASPTYETVASRPAARTPLHTSTESLQALRSLRSSRPGSSLAAHSEPDLSSSANASPLMGRALRGVCAQPNRSPILPQRKLPGSATRLLIPNPSRSTEWQRGHRRAHSDSDSLVGSPRNDALRQLAHLAGHDHSKTMASSTSEQGLARRNVPASERPVQRTQQSPAPAPQPLDAAARSESTEKLTRQAIAKHASSPRSSPPHSQQEFRPEPRHHSVHGTVSNPTLPASAHPRTRSTHERLNHFGKPMVRQLSQTLSTPDAAEDRPSRTAFNVGQLQHLARLPRLYIHQFSHVYTDHPQGLGAVLSTPQGLTTVVLPSTKNSKPCFCVADASD